MGFGAIAVLFMVGFFVAAVVAMVYMQKATVAAMKKLAAELGYEFTGAGSDASPDVHPVLASLASAFGSWRIEGREGGARVRIYTITRGSGKSRTTYTVVDMSAPSPVQGTLKIAREGFFSKIGKTVFGTQDIQAGDEAFDKAVIVKGSDEAAVKGLLSSSALRDAILRAITTYPTLEIANGELKFERQGLIKDVEFYRSLISSMSEVAKAMGG
jgi:hypothetical protein